MISSTPWRCTNDSPSSGRRDTARFSLLASLTFKTTSGEGSLMNVNEKIPRRAEPPHLSNPERTPTSLSDRLKANTIACFVLLLCIAFTIDSMPPFCEAHKRAQTALDATLDRTGLWQGVWSLFSPEPDSRNTRLNATVQFSDGSQSYWSSPNWQQMNALQRAFLFRECEYFENIASGSNDALLPYLAQYIVRQSNPLSDDNASPVCIQITRDIFDIPPPQQDKMLPLQGDWLNYATEYLYGEWF